MTTIGDTIYMNIDGSVDTGFISEMRSGIWVYDPSVGLYHRGSPSIDQKIEVASSGGLSLSNNVLSVSTAHNLKKGDAIVFDGVAGIQGVVTDTLYYADPVSTTGVKLAGSRKALQAGEYVTMTGTADVTDDFNYIPNTDYIASGVEYRSGAIIQTTQEERLLKHLKSEILWGARFDNFDGDTTYGLFSFADSWNIGSFTTQRIYSENIAQNWQNLYNFIDGLAVDSEQVIVKIQTKHEENDALFDGVWLDDHTINNESTSQRSLWTDIDIGDELVLIDGYGRGYTTHVTAIENSAGTVSVTVDETIGTTNKPVQFYRTTFKKIGQSLTLSEKEKETLKSHIADEVKASPWCRIKVELRGFTPAVNVMDLQNNVNRQG
jgi:hypothetical protein